MYELCRKHCGNQDPWKVHVPLLYKKSGSRSQLKLFRFAIRKLVESDHLPEYRLKYDQKSDKKDADRYASWSYPELVFTLALGNAKGHYGQADGRALLSQVASYLGSLTANSHGTARYIPKAEVSRIPVQPKMTTFIP